MTYKKLIFPMVLAILQMACTETPTKEVELKKTSQRQRIRTFKKGQHRAKVNKQEPIQAEENSDSKPIEVVSQPKPRPALSPAVQSLLANAEKSTNAGDLDSASVLLERALRISPRNAELTYQLAALRLKQSKPRLAEDLGKKAVFLATDDSVLKKRCWLLIAQAREQQGNSQGAKEAQAKADSLGVDD